MSDDFRSLREAVGIWHVTRVTVDAEELRQLLADYDRLAQRICQLHDHLDSAGVPAPEPWSQYKE